MQAQIRNHLRWQQQRGFLYPYYASPAEPPVIDAPKSADSPVMLGPVVFASLPESDETLFAPAAFALLQKIMAALGLKATDVQLLSLHGQDPAKEILDLNPRGLVVFGKKSFSALGGAEEDLLQYFGSPHPYAVFGNVLLLVVDHPEDMIREPQRKRPAWLGLQQLMEQMK